MSPVKKIVAHGVILAIVLSILTFYTYFAYRIGKDAGRYQGYAEAYHEIDLPSRNEILNLAEVCK